MSRLFFQPPCRHPLAGMREFALGNHDMGITIWESRHGNHDRARNKFDKTAYMHTLLGAYKDGKVFYANTHELNAN